ncbi:hypothetical protein G9A89_020241 [Geosiphon pyriformis]|nr:hypothetical protein G9A89_020241 [Geosiphon pyriformis]
MRYIKKKANYRVRILQSNEEERKKESSLSLTIGTQFIKIVDVNGISMVKDECKAISKISIYTSEQEPVELFASGKNAISGSSRATREKGKGKDGDGKKTKVIEERIYIHNSIKKIKSEINTTPLIFLAISRQQSSHQSFGNRGSQGLIRFNVKKSTEYRYQRQWPMGEDWNLNFD